MILSDKGGFTSMKRILMGLAVLACTVLLTYSAAMAEDQGLADPNAAQTPMPAIVSTDDPLIEPSAANAAKLYRSGGESAAYRYWETAFGHVPKMRMQKKVTVAMLQNAVGLTDDAVPVGRNGITFKECYEVPMPVEDEVLQKELDFNLHGSVYSDSALVSVTASFVGADRKEVETVTFDPAANVTAYSLLSDVETVEKKSLDDLFDISRLPAGSYTFTLSAKSTSGEATLHSCRVRIERTFPYRLERNKFDDNYSEASRFFGGETEKFLFTYSFRDKGRNVSTGTAWRESMLAESKMGRVHVDAVKYFDAAYDYTMNTYFKVDILRSNGEIRSGKVMLLDDLMEHNISPYTPRFQSNIQYVSHHTLGTAVDINEELYPNQNVITNHELIGNDVRDHLEYRGIETDDKGRQYYSFLYTGSYKAKHEGVPKTIVNWLLYELAFYRAGFQWGYYYETACDAMHFMLSENDYNKHIDSEVGLHKIWQYIGDPEPAPVIDYLTGAAPVSAAETPMPEETPVPEETSMPEEPPTPTPNLFAESKVNEKGTDKAYGTIRRIGETKESVGTDENGNKQYPAFTTE